MKKKLLFFVVLLFSVLNVFAAPEFPETIGSGKCGANLTWTLVRYCEAEYEYTLTISGTGSMYDYQYASKPWSSYKSDIQYVCIEDGVTSVGNHAFSDCPALVLVTIPNTVTSIGQQAFWYCTALSSIDIPQSVNQIGDYCLSSCTSLTSINVDAENPSYSSLDGVLYNKSKSNVIECPDGKLGKVSLPATVTYVGSYVFMNCAKLTSIDVDPQNDYYCSVDGVLFDKNKTSLEWYPAGREGKYMIPIGTKTIKRYVFTDSHKLTSLVIPETVTNIETGAFRGCDGATEVFCYAENVPTTYSDAFDGWNFTKTTLYVPENSIETYKTTAPWSQFKSIKNVEEAGVVSETDKFLLDNADILGKTTATVASSDVTAINKALEDYNKLSEAAKSGLATQKILLDALKTKAEELKAAEEYETLEQCAEPQIAFSDKTLAFSCATPDAEIHYSYYLSNVGTVKSTVQIPAETKTTNAITVIAYATADNYKTSKTVIQTFPFDATVHDINGDNKVTIADVTTLIDIIVNK